MLTNSQSLILCGCIVAVIFITGILGILDNFIVLTILTIMLITFAANLYLSSKSKDEEIENEE